MSMQFPTYEQFKAWLESKGPMEVVGEAQASYACPGANCARFYGAADPCITSRGWMDDYPGETKDVPAYAKNFISVLDRTFVWHAPIMAHQALAILNAVAP